MCQSQNHFLPRLSPAFWNPLSMGLQRCSKQPCLMNTYMWSFWSPMPISGQARKWVGQVKKCLVLKIYLMVGNYCIWFVDIRFVDIVWPRNLNKWMDGGKGHFWDSSSTEVAKKIERKEWNGLPKLWLLK